MGWRWRWGVEGRGNYRCGPSRHFAEKQETYMRRRRRVRTRGLVLTGAGGTVVPQQEVTEDGEAAFY